MIAGENIVALILVFENPLHNRSLQKYTNIPVLMPEYFRTISSLYIRLQYIMAFVRYIFDADVQMFHTETIICTRLTLFIAIEYKSMISS